jgi:WD40 repeat protein/uncharacterized caspase-like protein
LHINLKEDTMKIAIYVLTINFCFNLLIVSAQNPELSVQIGTKKPIYSVAVSPDGSKIVTGGGWMMESGEINMWDVETGKEIRTFIGHELPVNTVAFSPNGKWIISGSADKTVKLWDIESGKEIKSFTGHKNKVKAISFSPDSRKIVTASSDEIKLWEIETQREIMSLQGWLSDITSIAFSLDGKSIISNFGEKIKIWNSETGSEIMTFGGHENYIQSISISPNGNQIVTGGDDRKIKLWELETRSEIRTFSGNSSEVASVAFSPDGKRVIAGSRSDYDNLKLYDVETGNEIRTFTGHTSWVNSVAFTPDGKKIVSGSSQDKALNLWEVETGMLIRSFEGNSRPFQVASLSSDSKRMVTGQGKYDQPGEIRLWDLEMGKLIKTFTGHNDELRSIAISKDGKRILSGTAGNERAIKLWNVDTGKEVKTFLGHNDYINSLDFSLDGKRIISTSGGKNSLMIWDAESGKVIKAIDGLSSIYVSTISPDGTSFISGDGRDIIHWDALTGNKIKTFEGNETMIQALAFSPDGKTLVSGGTDSLAKLWVVETGKIIKIFTGHNYWVTSVNFSLDGKNIVTQSWDKTLKTWDIESGKELRTYYGDDFWIPNLAFSSDGKRIITGSADNTIKIIDVDSGYIVANFVAVDKNDYIVTTPDNYYTASKGAFKGVAFRIGSKIFPFEQFDLKFNRPDIILQRLGHAPQDLITSYKNAYLKRLRKMKFTEDMLGNDFHLPEIAISSKEIPSSTTSKNLTFKISAQDSKYPLDRVNVFINDVPVNGINGVDLRSKNISTIVQDITLSLLNGDNKIQVSVLNSKGAESLKKTFYTKYTGVESKSDLYVVAIGVSKYLDTLFNLTYASKDANDIAKFFESKKGNFGKVKIIPILDQNATKEAIISVKQVLAQSRVDDEVVIFFAGHGLLDDNLDYYLATTDIDFNNPAEKGLGYDELENLVDGIPALKKLIMIDACHSGEVDKDESVLIADRTTPSGTIKSRAVGRGFKVVKKSGLSLDNSYDLIKELFADLRRGSGAIVISSAGGAEYALESKEWNNGVFTYSVLEGMKTAKADKDKDGVIKISELKEYVIDKVQILTSGKQTPTSRQENLEFDFRVW